MSAKFESANNRRPAYADARAADRTILLSANLNATAHAITSSIAVAIYIRIDGAKRLAERCALTKRLAGEGVSAHC